MKKVKLLILALFVFNLSFSQDDDVNQESVSKVTFEIGAGANISLFNTEISEFGASTNNEFEPFIRVAPSIYGHVKYKFAENAFLKSGLILNFRGGAYVADDNSVLIISSEGSGNAKKNRIFRVNYLEIPFLVGYDLRNVFDVENSKNYKPINLAVGLTGGFNLSSDFRYNYYRSASGSGAFSDAKERYETTKFDFAESFLMNTLVEVSFVVEELKGADFWLYIRYNQSLGDVYTIDQINGDNFKTKMSTFTLGVSLEFL